MSSVTLTQISTNTNLGVILGDISSDGEVISYITKPTAADAVSALYVKRLSDGSITQITEFTVTDPLTTGIDGGALTSDGAFITYTVGALNGGVVTGVLNTIYLNETANPTPDENLIPIASALNEGFLPAEISGIYTLYGRNITIADSTDDQDSVVRRLNTDPFTQIPIVDFRDGSEPGAAGLLITPLDLSFNGTFALIQSELPLDGETDRDMDVFLVGIGAGGFTTRIGQNATSSDNSMSVNGQFIAFTMLGSQGPFDQVWVQERGSQGIVAETVVSTSAAGEPGNGDSFVTSLSDDGRFVAFISEATNLVPDDTNGQRDLFVKNLETGEVVRVAAAGTAASPTILDGELSADGTRIAFTTTANIGADQDNLPDVYVADLVFSTNLPPTAGNDGYSVDEDGSLTVAAPGVLANDSDPDNDALTAEIFGGATRGSVVLNADGSFTYTPIPNFHGPDFFTYKVSDGEAESAFATVSLNVRAVNDAPVAAADTYATDEDTALTIAANGVLANDTDVDGNALTAALVGAPTHGALTLNANGSLTYTPAAGYNGPDSFTYKANDGTADSNVATVSITVNAVNDRPVGVADVATVVEDASILIDVLANDTDVDGDALTIASLSGTTSALGASIAIENGKIRYTADADSFDLATFIGTTDTFTYTARDSGGLATGPITVQLTVTPANDQRTLSGTIKADNFTDAAGFDTTYFGNSGNDIVRGGDGSDTLHGQNDNDQLFGGAGIDFLFGGNGRDVLDGEAGNDFIAGGQGNDLMRGGGGSDTFLFEKNGGDDTVADFIVGVDHLRPDGMSIASVTTMNIDGIGQLDTLVSFSKGATVALLGVNGITDWDSLL